MRKSAKWHWKRSSSLDLCDKLKLILGGRNLSEELVWRIGGEAGMGIKAIGATFARMCTAAGYHVFDEAEYPSLIRGGHNTHQVVASTVAVHAGREKIDVLVALNDETITRHVQELFPKGGGCV